MWGNGYSAKTSPPGRNWKTDFQSAFQFLASPTKITKLTLPIGKVMLELKFKLYPSMVEHHLRVTNLSAKGTIRLESNDYENLYATRRVVNALLENPDYPVLIVKQGNCNFLATFIRF
jgi:hypothetical protein